MYNQSRVEALRQSLKDSLGDLEEEGMCDDGDVSFDLSIGIALMAESKEDAEEFLRGEWGYVPDSFKCMTNPNQKDA